MSEKTHNPATKRVLQILALILLSITAIYYTLVYAFDIEKKIIYKPLKEFTSISADIAGKVRIESFKTSDGLKLSYIHIKGDKKLPPVLYCHGNGFNATYFINRVKFLANNNYEVFMPDYSGYGQSEGLPSENGMYKNVEEIINHLSSSYKIDKSQLIIWGHSLGGAVVADIASRNKFHGVILEAAFTKMSDMKNYAAKFRSSNEFDALLRMLIYNSIPLTQKFETINKVSKIQSPLFLIHSKQDEIVPYQMNIELYKKNPQARQFLSGKGYHDDPTWNNDVILNFIKSLK